MQNENAVNQMKIYPNPAKGFVNVEYTLEEEKDVSILLYNLNGQLVKNCLNKIESNGKHSNKISVENLVPGIYQLHFKTGSKLNIYQILVSQ